MLAKILLTALVIAGVILYFKWRKGTLTAPARQTLMKYGAIAAVAALVLLVATGRLNWLLGLLGALLVAAQRLLPLLRFAPLVQRLYAQHRNSQTPGGGAGGQSRVRTDFVVMTLDHTSGEMDGEVLAGSMRGRHLRGMSLDDLLVLRAECARDDPEAVALVEAFLDRTHGARWRTHADAEGRREETHGAPGQGAMSRDEAYEVLGLEPGAKRDAIIEAHRRLIQKLHPDRGGSAYLASAINRAKDVLLDGLSR